MPALWTSNFKTNQYSTELPYSHGTSHHDSNIGFDYALVCTVRPPRSHNYPPGFLACPGFFESVDPTDFVSAISDEERWEYEMRRTAQMILPFLYIGPSMSLKNHEFLKSKGITLVLAIRERHAPLQKRTVNGDKAAAQLGIFSDYVEVDGDQELISAFPLIIRKINDHMCRCMFHKKPEPIEDAPSRRVLVFCETGNEKAAGVAAAYLMAMVNFDASRAIANIQGRRLCSLFSESMRRTLKSFDDILTANRAVTKSKGKHNGNENGTGSKRGLSPSREPGDFKVALNGFAAVMAEEAEQRRRGVAPFQSL